MDERDRPAKELLYDTEAALRLVDKALDEIRGQPDGSPDAPPSVAVPGRPPALALVRHAEPSSPVPPPPLAAELSDILEDIRLGRALLERARARRAVPYAAGAGGACPALGSQYVDGAAHLLRELEQRIARLAREWGEGNRE